MSDQLKYKGKFIKKKVLEKRLRMINSIENGRIKKIETMSTNNDSNLKVGKRIVDIDVLANNLICKVCETILSLKEIKKELRAGLHSTFSIECKKCGVLNIVDTGKLHVSKNKGRHADINTKCVLGMFFFAL